MANRTFNQYQHSLEKKPVHLWANISFSSGTPTIVRGKGISAVAKSDTGVYTVTLTDKYNALLHYDIRWLTNSASAGPTSVSSWLKSYVTTTGVMTFIFGTDRTTPADPADADKLYLHVTLSDSGAY